MLRNIVGVGLAVAIAWYWAIFLRSSNPLDALLQYYLEHPTDDVVFAIPIYLQEDQLQFPDLVELAQLQLAHELKKHQYDHVVNFKFDFKSAPSLLELLLPGSEDSKFHENSQLIEFKIRDVELLSNSPLARQSEFLYSLQSVFSNDLPYFLTQTVLYQLFAEEMSRLRVDNFERLGPAVRYQHEVNNWDQGPADVKIFVDESLNLTLIGEVLSFPELQLLYVDNVTETVESVSMGEEEPEFRVGSTQIWVKKADQGQEPVVKGDSIVVYCRDLDVGEPLRRSILETLETDVKNNLLDKLGLLSNPRVVPMRIDMELRFQVVNKLLKFLEIMGERKFSAAEADEVVELFETRSKVVSLLYEKYDWVGLYRLACDLEKRLMELRGSL